MDHWKLASYPSQLGLISAGWKGWPPPTVWARMNFPSKNRNGIWHASCVNIPSQLESSAQVMLVTHTRDEDPSEAAGQPKTSSINKQQIFLTEDSPQHSKTAADINLETPSRPMNEFPPPVQMNSGTFGWSETMSGADFTWAVSAAYEEEIHWWRNLFLTPSGHAGKSELAKLFLAFGEGSAIEPIALKAAITPALLLQKPHATSRPMTKLFVYNAGSSPGMRATSMITLCMKDTPSATPGTDQPSLQDDQRLARVPSANWCSKQSSVCRRKRATLAPWQPKGTTTNNCPRGTSQETSTRSTHKCSHPAHVKAQKQMFTQSCLAA